MSFTTSDIALICIIVCTVLVLGLYVWFFRYTSDPEEDQQDTGTQTELIFTRPIQLHWEQQSSLQDIPKLEQEKFTVQVDDNNVSI